MEALPRGADPAISAHSRGNSEALVSTLSVSADSAYADSDTMWLIAHPSPLLPRASSPSPTPHASTKYHTFILSASYFSENVFQCATQNKVWPKFSTQLVWTRWMNEIKIKFQNKDEKILFCCFSLFFTINIVSKPTEIWMKRASNTLDFVNLKFFTNTKLKYDTLKLWLFIQPTQIKASK